MTGSGARARVPMVFWAAVALGLALRIAVLVLSPDNPDTRSFEDTVRAGTTGLYDGVTRFNYSPLFAFVLYGLSFAAKVLGSPLRIALGAFLLAVDGATTAALLRRAGPGAAALFFLNPVSVFVSSFHLQFDGLAILFLVFDVELLFLYPWAVIAYGEGSDPTWKLAFGNIVFVEILVFLATLAIGYVYAWKKGVFQWR